MASQERSMPFIKNLASSDRKIRTAALQSLRTFLSAKHISTSLSTLDILKLWKGLFYALWMCDRPLPQQQLCADLADLLWVFPTTDVTTAWLRGFWATMAREWTTGIDVLRMEKFLLLVRRTLGVSLVWMQMRPDEEEMETKTAAATQGSKSPVKRSSTRGKKRGANGETKNADDVVTATTTATTTKKWNRDRVEAILELLSDWPFRPEEDSKPSSSSSSDDDDSELMPKLIPVGLKLHVLDIWVDEAEKAGLLPQKAETNGHESKEGETRDGDRETTILQSNEVLERLNGLVKKLNKETQSPAARKRSKEALEDERLPWNLKEEGEEEGDEWGGLDD